MENESGIEGGVFYGVGHNALVIRNTVFSKNKAATNGGTISTFSGPIQLENGEFVGNSAGGSGGAINAPYSRITAENTLFQDNTCTSYGGGLYGNSMQFSGVHFIGNYAQIDGAAFYVTGSIVLRQVSLDSNQSEEGRVAFLDSLVVPDTDEFSSKALAVADPQEETLITPPQEENGLNWVAIVPVLIIALVLLLAGVLVGGVIYRRRREKTRS